MGRIRLRVAAVLGGILIAVGGCKETATEPSQQEPKAEPEAPRMTITLAQAESRIQVLESQMQSVTQRVEDLENSQLIVFGYLEDDYNLHVESGTAYAVYGYISSNPNGQKLYVKGGNSFPLSTVIDSFTVGSPTPLNPTRVGKVTLQSSYEYIGLSTGTGMVGSVTIDRLPGYYPL